MSDPSKVYCEELGYKYITNETDYGEVGICVIKEDVYECEELLENNEENCTLIEEGIKYPAWEFFQGKVGEEHSYCAKQGYGIETAKDGQDSFSKEYAVCLVENLKTFDEQTNSKKSSEVGMASISSRISVSDLMDLKTKVYSEEETAESLSLATQLKVDSSNEIKSDTSIPSSFDWRNYNGKNWLTKVKSQKCGSCWAYAASAGVEAKYNIVRNNPYFDLDLSEQYLVSDCCENCGDCNGGWHGSALNFIKEFGVTDELCFEDEGKNLACSSRCYDWNNRLWKIDGYNWALGDRQKMKETLINKGPLPTSLLMDGYYDNGIYRCSNPQEGGHAILLVGYNDVGGYWIAKNSWGTGFEDNGYFKIGYGECDIEERGSYYIDLSQKETEDGNVQSINMFEGTIFSGTKENLPERDYYDLKLKEDCGWVGCDGLDARFSFNLNGLNDVTSISLVANHQARWEDNFRMEYWASSGNYWKHLEYLPDSEWYTFKYILCNSKSSCNSFINSNSNFLVRYYHPSCTWCDTDYVDVDMLYLEAEAEVPITCYDNYDCDDGNPLTTDKCFNSGTPSSYCTHEETPIICYNNLECGEDEFIGDPYCIGSGVYRDYNGYICRNPGESSSYCSTTSGYWLIKSCSYGCLNGDCLSECVVDEDCGVDYYSDNYCFDNNVYREFHNYSCITGGCEEDVTSELIETCNLGCIDGSCLFENKDKDGDGFCEEGYLIENAEKQCPRETEEYGTDCNDNDSNILPAYEGMTLYENTLLCEGNYRLDSGIYLGANGITLDCNGSTLIGNYTYYDTGISAYDINNIIIKNCIVKDYTYGIALVYVNSSIVENNLVSNNNYAGAVGIALAEADNNEIKNNLINQSYYGMVIYDSSDKNMVSNNLFSDNENMGLLFHIARWENLTIESNVIMNNSFIMNNQGIVFWDDYPDYSSIKFNNITENYFSQQEWLSMNLGTSGYSNNIWKNEIYNKDLSSSGAKNDYCINNQGNNYYDGATGPICEIICTLNTDCGIDSVNKYCNGDSSCETTLTYTCHNAGTEESYCTSASGGGCHFCQNGCNETTFECKEKEPAKLIINSPIINISNDRRLLLDIGATEQVDEIVYTYLDSRGREREVRLCRDCEGYNRQKSFSEGWNNLTFKAIVDDKSMDEENVSFFIDSKEPRISKTEPRRNSFTNGSGFYIKVREDNLKNITISFNPTMTLDLNKCTESRGYYECYIDLNLTAYNDQEINYYFNVEDIAGNKDESKFTLIKVDTTLPNLTNSDSFWTRGEGRYSNYIYFDMDITELNFDEAVLSYDYRGRTTEKRMCSNLRYGKCTYKFRLNDAYSNFKLIIRDDAGNSVQQEMDFND